MAILKSCNFVERNLVRLKWILIIMCLLALSPNLVGVVFSLIVNPIVSSELRDNPNGREAQEAMLLTFRDRTLPVNYLKEGNKVYIGMDGRWWQAFADEGIPVSMLIMGETYKGFGELAPDDPVYVQNVFSRLRPTTPSWFPSWLNAQLVVITLDSNDSPPRQRLRSLQTHHALALALTFASMGSIVD